MIAAAALAATAFAEVNIGLGANQAFAPVAYDGDDVVTVGPVANWDGLNSSKTGTGSGNKTGRLGISFSAGNDVAGIVTDIHNEDKSFDNAYGWVKPFSFLKISAGKLDGPWTRLGFGYGAWNTLRPSAIDGAGDDLAFYRPHQPNFQVLLTPVEGLEIVYDYLAEDQHEIYDEVWNHARYGVSYNIEGVGKILAQVYGADPYTNKDGDEVKFNGTANVAFQLTGIEGLDAQFGVKAPINFDAYATDNDGKSQAINIGAGVNYAIDAITLHAYFNGALKPALDGTDVKFKDFGFAIGAGVDYALSDAYTLLADVRFLNDKMVDTESHVIVFGGLEHHLTNANLKVGFVGETKSTVRGHLKDGKAPDFTFGVPVVLDINF